ncbi:MAG: sigma-70 family RNA polymerase sigma factor [Gemmatimonadota bacterium]|nr:sigma-70 family RNA polymerase sigma factor [Gemmatimonadota bacterium]MDH4350102.1 sigma-70 family RNA polymerase sigma factor [Gemmatimonadota bacterium]
MSQPPSPDREGFEREALVHLDAVYRTALRLSGSPMEAEDLAQETMFKAFRGWHQYEAGTNAKAWLLTILRNTFINRYRRTKQRPEMVDITEIEPYTVFHDVQDASPAQTFFDRLVDDEVLRAIDALPEDFREVLVLSDVEGLTYAEIAASIEAPVGTVKSRLFRARQLLQRELYDYAVEAGYIEQRRDRP